MVSGLDSLAGTLVDVGNKQKISTTQAAVRPARQALVVFPGYIMPGDVLSAAFSRHLGLDTTMLVAQYADRGLDMDDFYAQIMVELEKLKPERIRLYGASLGGMCAREFLKRYEQSGMRFGKVSLILDTAPGNVRNIKRSPVLFWFASWYRGGPISGAIWAFLSRFNDLGVVAEPDADKSLIEEGRRRSAWAGIPALATQANFIDSFPALRPLELVGVVDRMTYIHSNNPEEDPLVRVEESIAEWNRAFPALIRVKMDDRSGGWHIPLIERPGEVMRAILAV
ncbi:alpha/beta fold hydrolase [Amycolatopsis sp. EV170708-02-1]|uniref:alpha/beta fold hydrolase n=1 Tax=Amycolatopsis sp. EV170708-02-1 TaxID=2919322 RepID=UPI001F0C874F|nr:alpha/beta hydrolase [Amycolatopsis sp. EV170708-02-1]UMP01616.1 alpha/beta hydrolase [Amycolatopsis sp. EV170708-02-1]